MKERLILVVDDSATDAQVVKNMLEKRNFQVEWIKDASAALRKAEELMPLLILMDVVMPGMNGFQATRQIVRNEQTKNIPIVMMSTKDQETDKVWALRQGARHYFIKPANEKELVEKIESLIVN